MRLGFGESQELLRDTLQRLFADAVTPASLRHAEAEGNDSALWRQFTELGFNLLRVPEAEGGFGGSLIDAVVLAQESGTAIAPVPALEAVVAMRLLAQLDGADAHAAFDTIRGDATLVPGLALADADAQPEQIVPFGAVLSHVLVRRGEVIHLRAVGPVAPVRSLAGHGDLPLSAMSGTEVPLAQGSEALAIFAGAVEEWKLLQAAWLAANGIGALRMAAAYSCERHAFGRAVGSYQGLAHPMADAFVDVDGGALLVLGAVEAIGAGAHDAGGLIDLAYGWCGQAAINATVKAMRAYGGYGVSLEYDVQLYYRRAVAAAFAMGDPALLFERAARRLWAGETSALPPAGVIEINFAHDPATQPLADRVRQIFAATVNDERRAWMAGSDDGHDPELYRKLGAEGLLYPDLPEEFGGRGVDGETLSAMRQAFVEYGWPTTVTQVAGMVAAMIQHFGSDAARREILPRLASGEAYAALCYSEPACGSDIFAARTTARLEGDEWVINGQKMWTSQGHLAEYGLMLARTGEDKHGGITLFIVPLSQPGYSCTPIETLEERTNATFYDDVRVHDRYRLGEINGGIKVLAAALTLEQGGADMFVSELRQLVEAGLAALDAATFARADVRQRLARMQARVEVLDRLNRRVVWATAAGVARKYYGPATKLFGSESWLAAAVELAGIAAPHSLARGPGPDGRLERALRASIGGTIYGGTSEIQRSIVAEDGLGLPRSRS